MWPLGNQNTCSSALTRVKTELSALFSDVNMLCFSPFRESVHTTGSAYICRRKSLTSLQRTNETRIKDSCSTQGCEHSLWDLAFGAQWRWLSVSSGSNQEWLCNGTLIPSSRAARADKTGPALVLKDTINHLPSLHSEEDLSPCCSSSVSFSLSFFLFTSGERKVWMFAAAEKHSESLQYLYIKADSSLMEESPPAEDDSSSYFYFALICDSVICWETVNVLVLYLKSKKVTAVSALKSYWLVCLGKLSSDWTIWEKTGNLTWAK